MWCKVYHQDGLEPDTTNLLLHTTRKMQPDQISAVIALTADSRIFTDTAVSISALRTVVQERVTDKQQLKSGLAGRKIQLCPCKT